MATSQPIDVGTGSGSSDSDSIVHAENHNNSKLPNCSGCLPEDGESMIACDNCGEWYHKNCLNSVIDIPSSVWNDSSYKWICHLCN